jgi:calcineurin-like phosphoesterase family protein
MVYLGHLTHFSHTNIVKGISEWKSGTRDFQTQEEHVNTLIENINSMVGEDDVLFHLGDFSFGGIDKIWESRKRINCKNIHLILGNHDHHIHANKVLPNCKYNIDGNIVDNTIPVKELIDGELVFAKNLFTSVHDYLELSIDKQFICLSHYPSRMWNNSAKGGWFLHGHCHGNLAEYEFTPGKLAKTMDVGVDTNNLKPYTFAQIKEIMDSRHSITDVDHHNSQTKNHSKI